MAAALLTIAVFAPVVCGVLTLALPRKLMLPRVLVALAGPVTSFVCLLLTPTADEAVVAARWVPAMQMDLAWRADALGRFFALLVSGIGVLIVLYGRAYLGPEPRDLWKFYPLILLFMTAMLGLVLADQATTMLLFWEGTSVSSFLLIGWDPSSKKNVRSALMAFLTTGLGGLFLLGGLILLAVVTGVWSLAEVPAVSGTAAAWAFGLIFVGVATKSAQFPLHYWLPNAMAAPTPISAYLHSAAMVKAGIYVLARLWPALSPLDVWVYVVVAAGAFTMLYGAVMALRQDALKGILAFTTISQLGLLACAFGLGHFAYDGEPNIVRGSAQILNHAVYKAPLFILAGAMAHAVKLKYLSSCRGMLRCGGEYTLYAVLMLIGLYALAAGPGTFSFAAKEFFFYGIYHAQKPLGVWFWPLAGAAVLTGICNVALLLRFYRALSDKTEKPCSDRVNRDHMHTEDSPLWHATLWWPAALLIGLQFVAGIVAPLADLVPEATPFYFDSTPWVWYFFTHPGVPLYMSLASIAGGVLLGVSPLMRPGGGTWTDPFPRLFDGFYWLVTVAAAWPYRLVQSGSARAYVLLTSATLVAVLGLCWRAVGGLGELAPPEFTPGTTLLGGSIAVGLVVAATLVMPLARDRLVRVLLLGVVGFGVTAVFYFYAAPDLALTQISIEIVSLVLFLLALALLPEATNDSRGWVLPRTVVSVAVGLAMTAVVYQAATADRPERVATAGAPVATTGEYYLRNTYDARDAAAAPAGLPGVVDRGEGHLKSFGTKLVYAEGDGPATLHKGGGGGNAVNVILVDFRGFDTLGEIGVLGIAALGVWTLLRRQGDDEVDNRGEAGAGSRRERDVAGYVSSPILRTAAKLLVPLSLLFAVYVFFKGHQTPGGGFVGGLVASVALVVYRMTFGCDALYRLLPLRERTLIALGLLIALGSGLVGVALGLPMLTTNHGYLPLPGGGTFHWATVLAFDLGVALTVIGMVVGSIDALTRQIERRRYFDRRHERDRADSRGLIGAGRDAA